MPVDMTVLYYVTVKDRLTYIEIVITVKSIDRVSQHHDEFHVWAQSLTNSSRRCFIHPIARSLHNREKGREERGKSDWFLKYSFIPICLIANGIGNNIDYLFQSDLMRVWLWHHWYVEVSSFFKIIFSIKKMSLFLWSCNIRMLFEKAKECA